MLALPLAAHATLVVTPSIVPQIDDNVISNGCGSQIDGPALTIQGCMSQSHSTLVSFTANENIQFAAGGLDVVQTHIVPFTVKIAVVGHTFTSLILDNVETSKPGDITFTDGTTTSGNYQRLVLAGWSCFGLSAGTISPSRQWRRFVRLHLVHHYQQRLR